MLLNNLMGSEHVIDDLLDRLDEVGLEDACQKDRDRALYHLLVNHNVLVTRRTVDDVDLFAGPDDLEFSFAMTKLGLKP